MTGEDPASDIESFDDSRIWDWRDALNATVGLPPVKRPSDSGGNDGTAGDREPRNPLPVAPHAGAVAIEASVDYPSGV